MRSLRLVAIAVVATAVAVPTLPSAVARADVQTTSRAYLLAAEGEEYYWGVDPTDPELSVGRVDVQCGGTVWGMPQAKPCLAGTDVNNKQGIYALFFNPASLLDAPVAWSATEPLRFHLALNVITAAPYTVSFGWQLGVNQAESSPATEVSPGVWEGTLTKPGRIDGSKVALAFVRVRTTTPGVPVRFDLQTAGATYFDFPQAVPARAVPDLLAASTYRPAPSTFSSGQRSFTFNDDAWAVRSFSGDLTQTRTFDVTLDRDAEFVYAWVEAFATPLVYDLAHGRPPEQRQVFDGQTVSLTQDGSVLDRTGGASGQGQTSTAAVNVPAGTVTLTVTPVSNRATSTYTAYVLEVFGPRTLASFRETFVTQSARAVAVASCPVEDEPVPATEEVTTFSVDLDWDTAAVGFPKWTLSYTIPGVGDFPCGEGGMGDRVRFTMPMDHMWWVGATTTTDSATVSHLDTVYELKVSYAYTTPPAA